MTTGRAERKLFIQLTKRVANRDSFAKFITPPHSPVSVNVPLSESDSRPRAERRSIRRAVVGFLNARVRSGILGGGEACLSIIAVGLNARVVIIEDVK